MIFLGTQWIPHNKTEQWSEIFAKVASNPLPSCIKKWQTFSSADGSDGIKGINIINADGSDGIKGINIIYTEKGKGDEALIEITRTIMPFWEIEGYRWKLEPIIGVSDSMKALGKG